MLRVAVDALGADRSPASELEGCLQAARELNVHITMVGPEGLLENALKDLGWTSEPIEIVNATEVISMSDDVARAVRRKKDATIRVAMQLLRDGRVDAMVSAGNTGAVMMSAALLLGTLEGVERPALAMVLPTVTRNGTVLLDVGANADCKPAFLEQFAVMGGLYAEKILGHIHPRVGLLSIGEEDTKGNELTRETHKLLKAATGINFTGNVEGKDLFTGDVDVVVCDGFTGNVVLKTSEGLIDAIQKMLKEEMMRRLDTQAGAFLVRPAFQAFKKRLDYDEYGGAPLLGAKGTVIICHGRSNGKAIRNAIRVAKEFVERDVNRLIETELANIYQPTKRVTGGKQ
ncbi:MAG: phosphate acyltransferase PlsX [Blastocatellia bacterium]|nr:phosphate acyltransferase PlsX [Blastocatellia bacterium]